MHTQKETLIILDCSKMTLSRYVQDGKLTREKKGRRTYYNEYEVASLLKEFENNKIKYRPDIPKKEKQKIELPKDKEETLKNIDAFDILDAVGHKCLIDASKSLEEFGLYKECDKEVLIQYAISVQMYQKYLYLSIQCDSIAINDSGFATVHPHHRIAMDYQKQMQNYSDRLGLNPLARNKFTIKEKTEMSEMEKLLNGSGEEWPIYE